MLHRLRAWRADRHAVADTARGRYHHLYDVAREMRLRLMDITDPAERQNLLRRLAELQAAMAHNLRAGWRHRDRCDGPGRDTADSSAHAHDLYRLIADVEAAIAVPARGRLITHTDLEPVAGPILDRAVAAGRLDQETLDALYVAMFPLVGGIAAEVVACVPLTRDRTLWDYTNAELAELGITVSVDVDSEDDKTSVDYTTDAFLSALDDLDATATMPPDSGWDRPVVFHDRDGRQIDPDTWTPPTAAPATDAGGAR